MKTTMKTNNRFFILLSITVSVLFLCITSCVGPKKSLEDKCILKDPRYNQFVTEHNLQADIEEFLNENK
jgi:hypothetical protein